MNGKELRDFRLSLGWSQMKFASALGCHLSTVQKLEGKDEAGKVSPLLERSVMELIVKVEKGQKIT